MDVGIKNTRKGMVRSSKARITLLPGLNRVSEEQFAALKEDKMIAGLMKPEVGVLVVVPVTEKGEESDSGKSKSRKGS